jgi:transposase
VGHLAVDPVLELSGSWLLTFPLRADQVVFDMYRNAVRAEEERVKQIDAALVACAGESCHAGILRVLQAFRGIGLLSAVTIVAEVGDFRRFPTARHLMAYAGIVPSEHSSGPKERRGHITKAGNHLLRHVLIESGHHSRRAPQISPALRQRQAGLPIELVDMSWRAQVRLNQRYRQLGARIGRPRAIVAVARELAGFVWAAGRTWEGLPAA